MRIEHIALNVSDPERISNWYCKHLGMNVLNRIGPSLFLHDENQSVVLEMYCNPPDEVPDYRLLNPLNFHIAFYSENLLKDYERLLQAGATAVGNRPTDDDSHGYFMLRDPWGLPIQLIRRKNPL